MTCTCTHHIDRHGPRDKRCWVGDCLCEEFVAVLDATHRHPDDCGCYFCGIGEEF